MKRFVSPVILIVALMTMFAGKAMAQSATDDAAVTVTVPPYVAIEGLDSLAFSIVFSGAPARGIGSKTDLFTVEANVTTAISAAVTTPSPTDLTPYMDVSVYPTTGSPPSQSVTVTASADSVSLAVIPATYGERVTVTATKTP